jgi:hypothetical protein
MYTVVVLAVVTAVVHSNLGAVSPVAPALVGSMLPVPGARNYLVFAQGD